MTTQIHNETNKVMDRLNAESDFERQLRFAQFDNRMARLRGRRNRLLNLHEVVKGHAVDSRHFAGLQVVSIAKIRGSEGRWNDFDDKFRPLNEHSRIRWTTIAHMHRQGKTLPAVDLIQIGDSYFVRDGHHRISVARAFGQREIDANVTVWECPTCVAYHVPDVTRGRARVWRPIGLAQRVAHTVGAWLIAVGTRLQASSHPEQCMPAT